MCSVGINKKSSTSSEPQYVVKPRRPKMTGEPRQTGLADATSRNNNDWTAAIAVDAGQPVPPRRTKKQRQVHADRPPRQQDSDVTDGRQRRLHTDDNDDVQNDDRTRTSDVATSIDVNENLLHAAAAAETESELTTDCDEYTRKIHNCHSLSFIHNWVRVI